MKYLLVLICASILGVAIWTAITSPIHFFYMLLGAAGVVSYVWVLFGKKKIVLDQYDPETARG